MTLDTINITEESRNVTETIYHISMNGLTHGETYFSLRKVIAEVLTNFDESKLGYEKGQGDEPSQVTISQESLGGMTLIELKEKLNDNRALIERTVDASRDEQRATEEANATKGPTFVERVKAGIGMGSNERGA